MPNTSKRRVADVQEGKERVAFIQKEPDDPQSDFEAVIPAEPDPKEDGKDVTGEANLSCQSESHPDIQSESHPDRQSASHPDLQSASHPDFGSRFTVLERIGAGGMGSVYKVQESSTGKTLAIKTLQLDLVGDAAARKRFEQEAQSAINLNHPNLVSVFEHGTTSDGTPYIVMDYVEGKNLAAIIAEEGALETQRASNIFMQMAEALSYAHDNGIIHRDIKPTNVIITKTNDFESVRLVDFGLAMVMPSAGRETRDLTQTSEVFGSPHYMSPEQCLGFKIDERSDIYSFGCLMYECLTGGPPFAGNNPVQLVVKHIHDEPKPFPRELKASKAMKSLEAITFRCLQKDQALRFQKFNEILQDLELVKAGKRLPKYPKSERSRPWLTTNQVVGGLAIGCLLIFALPCVFSELISYSLKNQISYAILSIICASGTYVFLAGALRRFRNIHKGKASHRQWSLVVLHVGLGVIGLSLMPNLLTNAIFSFDSPHWIYPVLFAFGVLTGVGVLLVLPSTLAYCIFRSDKRTACMPVLLRMLAINIGIICGASVLAPNDVKIDFLQFLSNECDRAGLNSVALVLCQTEASLDKENGHATMTIAQIQEKNGDLAGAIHTWDKLLADNHPQHIAPYWRRAELLAKAKRYDEAAADMTTALDIAQKRISESASTPFLYGQRGKIRGQQGDMQGALADFAKSIELNPSGDNQSYQYRIAMYCSLEKYAAALEELDKIKKLQRSIDNWRITRALILEKLGRYAEASDQYRLIIKDYLQWMDERKDRQTRRAYDNRLIAAAYAYKKLGNQKEAERIFSEEMPLQWRGQEKMLSDSMRATLHLNDTKLDI